MSSLREDIYMLVATAANDATWCVLAPGALAVDRSKLETINSQATDSIMSAIDSHIPEKRPWYTAATFNDAVDLMREEVK